MSRVTVFLLVLMIAAAVNGCGKKTADEPTKYQSQAGLEALSRQAQERSSAVLPGSADNPAFSGSKEISAVSPEVKDLDRLLRPVLKKLFKDARIISASSKPETRADGEVIENRFAYAVKKNLVRDDGLALHSALKEAGFVPSVRLGTKPTKVRKKVIMSMMKTTPLRGYSLVINVDAGGQEITVESYKLGSKYDRP